LREGPKAARGCGNVAGGGASALKPASPDIYYNLLTNGTQLYVYASIGIISKVVGGERKGKATRYRRQV
jgi:hypothetical protein